MGLTTEQAVGMEFKVQATIRDRLEKASFKADLALLKNIFSRGINVEERVEETFRNDAMDVENNHGGNCPSDQFFLAVASINTLVQRCCSNVDDNAENDPRYEEHLDKVLKELMQFGGDDFSVLLGTYRNQENHKTDKRSRAADKLKDTAYEICKVVNDFYDKINRDLVAQK